MKTPRSLLRTLNIERKKELMLYNRSKEIHIRHALQFLRGDGEPREISHFSYTTNRFQCRNYFLRPITEKKYNSLKTNDKYFLICVLTLLDILAGKIFYREDTFPLSRLLL